MKLSILLAAMSLLCSGSLNAQWTHIGLAGKDIREIATANGTVYALSCPHDTGSVYKTTDVGVTWNKVYRGLLDSVHGDYADEEQCGFGQIAVSTQGTVFAIKRDVRFIADTLLRSHDGGADWTAVLTGQLLIVAGSPVGTVLAGDRRYPSFYWQRTGIRYSTDDGITWNDGGGSMVGTRIALQGNSAVSCGEGGGTGAYAAEMHISSDGGLTWRFLGYPPLRPAALSMNAFGVTFFGGDRGGDNASGLYRSTDTCKSWSFMGGVLPMDILSLPSGGVLVGTNGEGIFLFSDDGDSLGTRNDGLSSLSVHALEIDAAGYLYAGTQAGVFRIPASQVTALGEVDGTLPGGFQLHQNYPNPFNPGTTIRYALPARTHVTLTVFNTLGQRVAVVVQGEVEPGYHDVTFDASDLASGVYLYRLEAGNFVQTRRLVLVK